MAQDFRNENVPLGLKNNNPGNIRPGKDKWQGAVGTNKGFIVFQDIAWGIRAWLKDYHTDQVIHRLNTLEAYITAYAPPKDGNDTAAYIRTVSARTGIPAGGEMPTDRAGVTVVFRTMIAVENGAAYAARITDDDINEAFDRLSGSAAGFFLT